MKIIIFDMDGVLADTIPKARENFLKQHVGVTADMYNEIHTGNYYNEAAKYTHLRIPETETEKEINEKSYIEMKSKSPLFNKIDDLLQELHSQKYVLVLNTNASDKNCLPLLENLKIKHLFDFIATANISKDKAEKFKLIAEKYGVHKKDMLFVTDALGDVKDATTAGISTIAVTWGVHNRTYFERERHTHLIGIVDTVDHLLAFIKEQYS